MSDKILPASNLTPADAMNSFSFQKELGQKTQPRLRKKRLRSV